MKDARVISLSGFVVLLLVMCATTAGAAGTLEDPFVRTVTRVYPSVAHSDDNFGNSVAISGDTAVVGAPGDDAGRGAAYVYARAGTSTWAFQVKLVAPARAAGDRFGTAVAISGDTIVVGAPQSSTIVGAFSGSADVFVRSVAGWGHQETLYSTFGHASDFFGGSVAVDGDIAVVGSKYDDTVGDNAGTALVFTRTGTDWTPRQYLYTGSGAPHDYDEFGTSVAISGATIVVGSPKDDSGAVLDHGCAHVYFPSSTTTWVHQGWLLQPGFAAEDRFGYSVAISGNSVLVGSRWDDTTAGSDGGSAHVFLRTGTNWGHQQGLWDADGDAGDQYGRSVAIEGDLAVIGAIGSDAGVGSTYFYSRSGTAWTMRQHMVMTGLPGVADAGYSVGLSKGTAFVGAPMDDAPTAVDSGTAYVFARFNDVRRFFNRRNGTHFYTPSLNEVNLVMGTWPDIYTYEGRAYLVNPENNNQPLYRFYNRRNGSHFYTASATERDSVMANLSAVYSYDGPTYKVSTAAAPGKPPVWRFFNKRNGSHFYTASESEKASVIANLSGVYTFEGTAFWLGQ